MTIETALPTAASHNKLKPALLERFARRAAFAALARLRHGRLTLHEGDQTHVFGPESGRAVSIQVHSPRLYSRLLLEGSLGGGRAWIEGDWSCDDLPGLLRFLLSESKKVRPQGLMDSPLTRLASASRRLMSVLNRNSPEGSRRNIAAHYDLGNDFYQAMLDPSMTYSSALFSSATDSLESAQTAKYDRLCKELDLRPEHRLLEIGSGWGGFAIHAAGQYGCHVTTTTISQEQFEWVSKTVSLHGLDERIEVLCEDYRNLDGQFDRLVSIEMIEAVGAEYLDTFFSVCSDRLTPEGMMGLQAIIIRDQAYERSRKHVDFIKQYVFPGGFLPSVAAISDRISRVTDFRMHSLHDMTSDYAETLRRWRQNLSDAPHAYHAVSRRAEFKRLWEFYLAYCEAGFEERHIGCVQITLTKSDWRDARTPNSS